MMAMLNVLVSICGACMMYHTEYADNGMQKMSALPVRQGNLFFGKFVIAALVLSAMVVHGNGGSGRLRGILVSGLCALTGPRAVQTAGFQIAVTLPTVMLMLVIASACRNMWVSLGIGVILVFTLSMFPRRTMTALSLFPFASPCQTLCRGGGKRPRRFMSCSCLRDRNQSCSVSGRCFI